MNCVPPLPEFLPGLRPAATRYGALLIIDEVMTGFRVALAGAQSYYGVEPDLTCLGKIIGGGMPVGTFGGRRDVMEALAPSGPIYQSGHLSVTRSPLAACYACLTEVSRVGVPPDADQTTEMLAAGPCIRRRKNIPLVRVNNVGGMFGLFFTDAPAVTSPGRDAVRRGTLQALLPPDVGRGVYLAPSPSKQASCPWRTAKNIQRTIDRRASSSPRCNPAGWRKNGRLGARFIFRCGLQQRAVMVNNATATTVIISPCRASVTAARGVSPDPYRIARQRNAPTASTPIRRRVRSQRGEPGRQRPLARGQIAHRPPRPNAPGSSPASSAGDRCPMRTLQRRIVARQPGLIGAQEGISRQRDRPVRPKTTNQNSGARYRKLIHSSAFCSSRRRQLFTAVHRQTVDQRQLFRHLIAGMGYPPCRAAFRVGAR